MSLPPRDAGYGGAENLEVMREARNYNAWLLRLIHRYAPASGHILDFGAGQGTFALPLQLEGRAVTCVEPDPALAASLRAQGLTAVSTVAQLENGAFDFAYTLNVLEHIEDDAAALAALHARLRPGGRLLVYVPAFQVLYGPMDRRVGHLRRYRRLDLVRRVRAAGFTIEKSRYADSIGFFAALAFRLLRSDSTGDLERSHVRLYDGLVFPLSLALDLLCRPFFGKNVTVLARR